MTRSRAISLGVVPLQVATALVLFLPVLLFGEPFTHSDRINHTWVELFTRELMSGEMYPRWLYDSFGEMGAPSFYFYPPAFFYIAAAVRIVSLGAISTQYAIPIAGALISAASGIAMFAFLRYVADRKLALIGATLYQLAPYHVVDFYLRGALGEFTAYVFMPLIVLGMNRVAASQRWGAIPLGLGYAGLIYSHLPGTVLFSVVLACYAVFLALTSRSDLKGRFALLFEIACWLLVGIALATPYVLPALTLLQYTSTVELWTPFHRPENWLIQNFDHWPLKPFNFSMLGLALGMAVPATYMLLRRPRVASRENLFWAGVTAISFPLMLGVFPWFWQVSPIDKVQFPFRFLMATEFAFIAACVTYLNERSFNPRQAQWLAAGALIAVSTAPLAYRAAAQVSVLHTKASGAIADWEVGYRDADVYLPPQFFASRPPDVTYEQDRSSDGRYSAFGTTKLSSLQAQPLGRLQNGDGQAAVTGSGRQLNVEVDASGAGKVIVKRFYFPTWTATGARNESFKIEPTADGLVSVDVPAGKSRFVLTQRLAAPARVARIPCLAAALLLTIVSFVLYRKKPRPYAAPLSR